MPLATSVEFDGHRRRVIGQPNPVTVHEAAGACKGQVLIVPGWSGPRSGPADLLVHLASELARSGWRVLRLDHPGRGDAEGSFGACSLDDMVHAALMAHGMLISPPERAFILGLCSGGNVALGVVSTDAGLKTGRSTREELNRVGAIALSTLPFQPARSASFERRRRWKNLKQYAAKVFSPATWLRLLRGEINLERVKKNVTASEKPAEGERNLKDSARDIEKELLSWKGPALFIWGGGDEEAALARAHFETMHAGGMGRPQATRFHTIAGSNHNFYARACREELTREILAFLDQPTGQ